MSSALKKIYVPITGMLIAVIGQVNAADYNPSTNCKTCDCCTQSEWNFRGELLYWRAALCGLESAFGSTTIATTVDGGFITTTVRESDREPDFEWNPGFRVGAGVVSNCLFLDTAWTHYNGRAKFHDNEQRGQWKIRYDAVDLIFGRRFCATSCFYFKPFVGFRAVRIHQTLKSHSETLFTSIIGDNTVTSDLDDREDFWGIGPEIGIEADWYLGCNLSLYGSFAVVPYYGRVKSQNFDTDTFTSTISVSDGDIKRCFNSVATDGAIGVRWDRTWGCSCYDVNLMLRLGLEQHRIYDFSNLGSDGTLSMDGAVFAVGVGFHY